MKTRILTACVVLTVLAAAVTAQASIRDNPGYVPSTGLTLGAWDTVFGGVEGYVIASEFQINLEYQPGILDEDIDEFNAYDPTGTGALNFEDHEVYVLRVNTAGGLPTWLYPDEEQSDSGNSNIQWTLTGWHQTIFAGDIVNEPDGTVFLRVDPTQGYRSFPTDELVNDVEIFGGIILSEVVGYTFDGPVCDIKAGSVLGVRIVPEPTSLLIWGVLAATCLGGVFVRRRK
ncbi:MAG: hypothetical protein JW818_22010 [Pirellulales bacterium]|nr:hypothetical protein [Pirellulales bacterium]